MIKSHKLSDIPVKIEGGAVNAGNTTGTVGGGLIAILRELSEMLERLAAYDETAAIDLRSLPFSPSDYQSLREFLGDGEVEVTLSVAGMSRVRETGFSGIWWVEHHNPEGELLAELLEITNIPEILVTEKNEVAKSASKLRERLSIHTAGGNIQ
jgi:HupH hydrogenase expression protein, C-terminal conserved region